MSGNARRAEKELSEWFGEIHVALNRWASRKTGPGMCCCREEVPILGRHFKTEHTIRWDHRK
jgi:hypothetical protein